jgi:hypothetical protein
MEIEQAVLPSARTDRKAANGHSIAEKHSKTKGRPAFFRWAGRFVWMSSRRHADKPAKSSGGNCVIDEFIEAGVWADKAYKIYVKMFSK